MLLHFAAVLRAPVGQYSQHWQALRHVKWQHAIIQQVSRCNRRFSDIQLAVRNLRVRINERLLINTSDTFQVAHVERVLRAQITRMRGFNFTAGLVITGFAFQCSDLAVVQFYPLTSHFFFQCFQTLLKFSRL